MKLLLILCLWWENHVFFKEMYELLIVDPARLMFDPLERRLDACHVQLLGVKLKDSLHGSVNFGR
jgi:hypothetical protein